jgi:hypothetical protein
MTHPKNCERCGVPAADTEMGMLAYNGSRLVCSDCDSDITAEWVAEEAGRIHPLDALNPVAHVLARMEAQA